MHYRYLKIKFTSTYAAESPRFNITMRNYRQLWNEGEIEVDDLLNAIDSLMQQCQELKQWLYKPPHPTHSHCEQKAVQIQCANALDQAAMHVPDDFMAVGLQQPASRMRNLLSEDDK